MLDPILIVEVLSDPTEPYDQGEKFRHFQTVPTPTDYLLVSQHEARAELFTCRDGYWEPREVSGIATSMTLPSVEVTLVLTDVYALIEWPGEGSA